MHNQLCFSAYGFRQYRHPIRNSRQTGASYSSYSSYQSYSGNPQCAIRNPQLQLVAPGST